mmetsp:Transcript_13324/g.19849  ORF Transcript_13324/g.19849 Transcript_13324/m.19849 type:complete len:133 (-) Transcript_13324:45-443(-)
MGEGLLVSPEQDSIRPGPSTNQHQQRRKRLQDEARVWIDAPSTESLVPIHCTGTLKRDITRATSETIATWLHRQRQLRKRIRDNKKTKLITHFLSEDTLKEADRSFHGKLLAARRGTREQLDTIITNEEPPD